MASNDTVMVFSVNSYILQYGIVKDFQNIFEVDLVNLLGGTEHFQWTMLKLPLLLSWQNLNICLAA